MTRGSLMLAAIILARNLETQQFSNYSYYQLTITMLSTYAALGIGITTSKFFASATIVNEEHSKKPPIATLWLTSILTTAIATIAVIFIPDNLINPGNSISKWLLALGVFILGLGIVPSNAILGLEAYKKAALISIFSGLSLLVGTSIAVVHRSSTIAMLSIVISSIIRSAGESFVAYSILGWKRIAIGYPIKLVHLQEVYKLAGPMLLVSITSASASWLVGRVILSQENGAQSFAIYAIGLQWFSLALVLPGMISRVVLPRLVHASHAAIESFQLIRHASKMAFLCGIIVSLVGVVCSPFIATIYGGEYSIKPWFLWLFLFAALLAAPINTIGNAFIAKNMQNSWLFISLFRFFVLIITAFTFSELGAWTGAISYASSYLTFSALAIIIAKRNYII